ncbi:glycoside hydrolase family 30 protein [Daejeonella lutea]|nr:glycoside hydrolase family 30 beta sandwich domain-containing protein [Daejeonella lutea]
MRLNVKCILQVVLLLFSLSGYAQKAEGVALWLTNADRSALFEEQQQPMSFSNLETNGPTIAVDDKNNYQEIDGFGFSLTQGSAMHIIRMEPAARAALLKELFAQDGKNIGISYIRLSIGASDLNERIFSYNDLPAGETDPEMLKFNLGPDHQDVIPVMKEILTINPDIKIMGSPWSPPVWMKLVPDTRGSMLKPEWHSAYAKYFVRYIQDMKKEGIAIDAITVQNEPLHPGNNPSLLMPAPDQAIFIKNHLGPAFKKAGIKTKIVLFDHNADRPDYAISIMDDPEVKQYVDGSGFHLYAGRIEALSDVHAAHPDKNVYFTEQMVTERPNSPRINITNPVGRLIIGATRNWSRNVIEWNLAADPQNKPYTDRGGCPSCQGAITIDKNTVTRNLAYYSVAHASKFVRPGSVRISSNEVEGLLNVAFKNPQGKRVLIVANTGPDSAEFNIKSKGKVLSTKLNSGSVGTYIW